MFGNPVPAHYVARAEKLPILTVVFNNQMWGAVKRNTREVYPGGFAAKINREPLTYFDPRSSFEKAVETSGGYGERSATPPKCRTRSARHGGRRGWKPGAAQRHLLGAVKRYTVQ